MYKSPANSYTIKKNPRICLLRGFHFIFILYGTAFLLSSRLYCRYRNSFSMLLLLILCRSDLHKNKSHRFSRLFSVHITDNGSRQVADYTAGWELHPTPKNLFYFTHLIISQTYHKCKSFHRLFRILFLIRFPVLLSGTLSPAGRSRTRSR